MSMKYTPGPWVAGSKSVSAPETENRLGLNVQVYGGNASDNRANALLIAAAPDMLAALQIIEAQSIGVDWTAEQAFKFIKQTAGEASAKAQCIS